VLLLLSAQTMSVSAAFVKFATNEKTVESNLRVPSNESLMLTFKQSIWNNTFTTLMQNDVEMVKAKPPKVNKMVYVLLCMTLGCCGCDRCFMGQICLGVCKGITGGGFLIWQFIDYFVALISALTQAEDIDMMGYHATFEKDSIHNAFYVAIFLFGINVINVLRQSSSGVQQRNSQNGQQEALLEAIEAYEAILQQQARSTRAADNRAADKKASLDIPMRHQSLAYLPTTFTKGLRKAGIVTENPTIPELIAAFDKMDVNGDGQLDHEEIKEGMKAMGASDEKVDKMIKAADTAGDGKISKNEFLISYHNAGKQ